MKKRLVCISLITVLTLSGCGSEGKRQSESTEESHSEAVTEAQSEADIEDVKASATEASASTESKENSKTSSTEKAEDKNEVLVEPSTEILTEATTEDVEDQSEEYLLTDIENLDEQLAVIAENAGIWKLAGPSEEDGIVAGPEWLYTVTDLDKNGRLEVITSTVQGSGLFTTSKFYEVSADYKSLDKVVWEVPEGSSEPDITIDMADAYINEADGTLYYIFDDVVKASAADIYEVMESVTLKNGVVDGEVIGSSHMFSSDEGETVETEYFDKNQNSLTIEEYEELCQTEFPAFKKGALTLGWNSVDGMTDSFPEDAEDIKLLLEYSSTGFAISFE